GLVKPSAGVVRFGGSAIAQGPRARVKKKPWQALIDAASWKQALRRAIRAGSGDEIGPHVIVGRGLVHAPEGRGIFANMTVEENLELGAFLRRDDDQIAKDREHALSLFPRLRE